MVDTADKYKQTEPFVSKSNDVINDDNKCVFFDTVSNNSLSYKLEINSIDNNITITKIKQDENTIYGNKWLNDMNKLYVWSITVNKEKRNEKDEKDEKTEEKYGIDIGLIHDNNKQILLRDISSCYEWFNNNGKRGNVIYSTGDTILLILDLRLAQFICYKNGKNKECIKTISSFYIKNRKWKLGISLYNIDDSITVSFEEALNLQSMEPEFDINILNNASPTIQNYYRTNYFNYIVSSKRFNNVYPMSYSKAEQLRIGNYIDYRDDDGRYITATVIGTKKDEINIIINDNWNTWINIRSDLNRIAIYKSVSIIPAYQLKIGDFVFIKIFSEKNKKWKLGQIHYLSDNCGEVQIVYSFKQKKYYWTHLDNDEEIICYGPYNDYMSKKIHFTDYKKLRKEYESETGVLFTYHMTLEQVQKLNIGDMIDYRRNDGKYIGATVIEINTNLQKMNININNEKYKWIYIKNDLHKIFFFESKSKSKSKQSALRFKELKIGTTVAIKPMSIKTNTCFFGVIEKLDNKSCQIQVSYMDNNKQQHLYWMDLDNNKKEIFAVLDHNAPFDKKLSCTEIYDLEVGDKIDYRQNDGKYVIATIYSITYTVENKVNFSVQFDDESITKIEDQNDLNKRLRKVGSITNRPAHQLKELKINDYVFIKWPFLIYQERKWKLGQIHCILKNCDQVEIQYFIQTKSFPFRKKKYCWIHLDNKSEIIQYGAYQNNWKELYNMSYSEYRKLKYQHQCISIESNKYNQHIVSQLLQFGVGTKEEIIEASKQSINPNDIIQVQQKVEKLQKLKRRYNKKQNIEYQLSTKQINIIKTREEIHIKDLDKIIGEYYCSMDINGYYDENKGIGKFEIWCNDNGYDTEMIHEEFENSHQDIDDYYFIEFDDEFPLNDKMKHNAKSREENILNFMLFCYNNGYPPKPYFTIFDFNLQIDSENVKKCKEIVKSITNKSYSNDLLEVLSIGYDENNYNFFMYFLDSFERDKQYSFLNKNEVINATKWIKNNDIFRQINNKNNKLCKKFISILSEDRMYKPSLLLIHENVICDHVKTISNYVATLTQFINLYLIKQENIKTPFQIDCIFAFGNMTSQSLQASMMNFEGIDDDIDDDYNDNDEFVQCTDFIGNIQQRLKNNNDCKYISREFIENENILIQLKECYNKFKENNYNLHNKRICILFDRRNSVTINREKTTFNNKHKVFMYEPSKESKIIPNSHIHESMINLSNQCLIPGKNKSIINNMDNMDNESIIISTDLCKGTVLTFSFHIESMSEIRCYLYWFGGILRFYPLDILTILPKFFYSGDIDFDENMEFIESDEAKRIAKSIIIKDEPFEYFYNHLTNNKDIKFQKIILNQSSWKHDYILVIGYIRTTILHEINLMIIIQDINNLIFRYYR